MLPSNTDLTYFVEIAQTANLTHAAERLGVSQPSLSLAIQRLEHSVGTSLLIRSRQGVKLTKAGEILFTETRSMLDNWERIRNRSVEALAKVQGRFTLGCHPSVARYSLPLFLPEFLKNHPEVELVLTHDLSRHVTQSVLKLELDLGIVVNPVRHPDLVIKHLANDVVTFWKSKHLKNEDVLICDTNILQTQSLLKKLSKSGMKFKRIVESANLEVVGQLVDSGCGVGILPARVAGAQKTELIAIKGAPKVDDEVCLIYRTENRNVLSLQALSLAIQEGFKKG